MAREVGWYGWFRDGEGGRYEAYWDGAAWTDRRPQQVMVPSEDDEAPAAGHAPQAAEIKKGNIALAILGSLAVGATVVPLVVVIGLTAIMSMSADGNDEGGVAVFYLLAFGGIAAAVCVATVSAKSVVPGGSSSPPRADERGEHPASGSEHPEAEGGDEQSGSGSAGFAADDHDEQQRDDAESAFPEAGGEHPEARDHDDQLGDDVGSAVPEGGSGHLGADNGDEQQEGARSVARGSTRVSGALFVVIWIAAVVAFIAGGVMAVAALIALR
ncbi:MAG: hypothetical protein Q3979_05980 [Actinomycetaceae bacterium]|nr:hypothetical protein [Actinomycetaceae bacterium]